MSLALEKHQRLQARDLFKRAALVKLGRSFKQYFPHPKQRAFHALGNMATERMFMGGNRTGKTVGGTYEVAMHLTGVYPDWWDGFRFGRPVKAWAASETAEVTRDVLQAAYIGSPENGFIGTIPQERIKKIVPKQGVSGGADLVYIESAMGGVSVLQFKDYAQGRKKFQGRSRDIIHLDEEPEHEIYQECLMRLLDVNGMMLVTMSPLQGVTKLTDHFMQERASGQPVNQIAFVRASWWDNIYLPAGERDRLMGTMSARDLKSRAEGYPDEGGGRAHPDFTREDNVATLEDRKADLFVGMDFNVENMSAVIAQYGEHTRCCEVIDEIVFKERNNTEGMCQEIKNRYPGRSIIVCPDASGAKTTTNAPVGQSDISILRSHGFQVLVESVNPLVKDRVANLNALICDATGQRNLKVDPRCKEFINCLLKLRCPDGQIIPDKKSGLDHLPDAAGYLAWRFFRIVSAKVSTSKVKAR